MEAEAAGTEEAVEAVGRGSRWRLVTGVADAGVPVHEYVYNIYWNFSIMQIIIGLAY